MRVAPLPKDDARGRQSGGSRGGTAAALLVLIGNYCAKQRGRAEGTPSFLPARTARLRLKPAGILDDWPTKGPSSDMNRYIEASIRDAGPAPRALGKCGYYCFRVYILQRAAVQTPRSRPWGPRVRLFFFLSLSSSPSLLFFGRSLLKTHAASSDILWRPSIRVGVRVCVCACATAVCLEVRKLFCVSCVCECLRVCASVLVYSTPGRIGSPAAGGARRHVRENRLLLNGSTKMRRPAGRSVLQRRAASDGERWPR